MDKLAIKRQQETFRLAPWVVVLASLICAQGVLTDYSLVGLRPLWVFLRFFLLLIAPIFFVLYKKGFFRQNPVLPLSFFNLYIASMHVYFLSQTGHENSLYFHSFLQLLFGISMVPLSFLAYFLNVFLVIIIFSSYILTQDTVSYTIFTTGPYAFLKTYILIVVSIYFLMHVHRSKLYKNEIRLEELVADQKDTIKKNVAEISAGKIHKAIAKSAQMMAHDVRKPLILLQAFYKNILSAGSLREASYLLKKSMPEIESAQSEALAMVQDVLDVSSGKVVLARQDICPLFLLEKALARSFSLAMDKKIALRYSFKISRKVSCDEQKLLRVLTNIIGNALELMPKNGEMWFNLSQKQGKTQFCIGNSGTYIPPMEQKKIFDAFYTKNRKNGVGLGLCVVKKIIEAHGGHVFCRSDRQNGTQMIFTLLSSKEKLAPQKSHLKGFKPNASDYSCFAASHLLPGQKDTKKGRILLIEDSKILSESWQGYLSLDQLLCFDSFESFKTSAQKETFWHDVLCVVSDYYLEGQNSALDVAGYLARLEKKIPIYLYSEVTCDTKAFTDCLPKDPYKAILRLKEHHSGIELLGGSSKKASDILDIYSHDLKNLLLGVSGSLEGCEKDKDGDFLFSRLSEVSSFFEHYHSKIMQDLEAKAQKAPKSRALLSAAKTDKPIQILIDVKKDHQLEEKLVKYMEKSFPMILVSQDEKDIESCDICYTDDARLILKSDFSSQGRSLLYSGRKESFEVVMKKIHNTLESSFLGLDSLCLDKK